MAPPQDAPPLTLGDLAAALQRHHRYVILAAILALVAVLIAAPGDQGNLYRAEATVSASRGLKPVDPKNSDPLAGQIPDQMVNSLREMLLSKDVLAEALAMGNLMDNPAYRRTTDPVQVLGSRLRTQVVKNSWVIIVTLDDEDPIRAERGLDAVLAAFQSQQASEARRASERDLSYITSQLTRAGVELATAQEAERVYRTTHGIASTDPDQNHLTARMHSLAVRQAELDGRISASAAQVRQLQAAESHTDAGERRTALLGIDNISSLTVIGNLQIELLRLEGQEAELAAKYLEKHPKLIELRSHLAAKRAQFEELLATARSTLLGNHALLLEERKTLDSTMEELQRDLGAYREKLVGLQALVAKTQVCQRLYEELSSRQAQITTMATYDDRRLVVNARPRAMPVPALIGRITMLALALAAAAAAAITTALVADALDPRLRSAAAAADLCGLPLLAEIPRQPALPALALSGPEAPLAVAETMRGLLARLRLQVPAGPAGLVILVASPASRDGRTTLTARLAAAMALSGLRTLAVDAHLRHPGLAREFGVDREQGLAHLLVGQPGLAPLPRVLPNLDFMPAGASGQPPGELLHSPYLAEWLAAMRQHYDAVVIDSAPAGESADAMLLTGTADACLLLVNLGQTTKAQVRTVWRQFQPLRQRFAGCAAIAC